MSSKKKLTKIEAEMKKLWIGNLEIGVNDPKKINDYTIVKIVGCFYDEGYENKQKNKSWPKSAGPDKNWRENRFDLIYIDIFGKLKRTNTTLKQKYIDHLYENRYVMDAFIDRTSHHEHNPYVYEVIVKKSDDKNAPDTSMLLSNYNIINGIEVNIVPLEKFMNLYKDNEPIVKYNPGTSLTVPRVNEEYFGENYKIICQ